MDTLPSRGHPFTEKSNSVQVTNTQNTDKKALRINRTPNDEKHGGGKNISFTSTKGLGANKPHIFRIRPGICATKIACFNYSCKKFPTPVLPRTSTRRVPMRNGGNIHLRSCPDINRVPQQQVTLYTCALFPLLTRSNSQPSPPSKETNNASRKKTPPPHSTAAPPRVRHRKSRWKRPSPSQIFSRNTGKYFYAERPSSWEQ